VANGAEPSGVRNGLGGAADRSCAAGRAEVVMTAAVCQLGYLGFDVADLAAWRRLATDVLACEVNDSDGEMLLRVDERPFRIALAPSERNALRFIGWEAASAQDHAALVERIRVAGVAVEAASVGEAEARHVAGLARFHDPGGFAIELYHGPQATGAPLATSRPSSGFKTGELGLGHIVLHYANYKDAVRFYTDVLGFRLSDTADLANAKTEASFLHCNPRHHSLAIIASTPERQGVVSHFMLEAHVMEDVGRAYDICRKQGFPIGLTLGQHTNDRMLSFYLQTPSGFALEFGYGGLEIDDSKWEIQHWKTGSYWGHARNAAP
jgi:2,3-dihydroxybiphenyl 1,2-dioxygenase